MATAGVPLWSTTAASNSTADPAVNWAEGQAPSSINDSARAMMASVAKWRDDLYGLTTAGTSTAFTVATNATYATAAAMSGAVFTIIPNADSGIAPTLAVDGLAARALNISTGGAIPTGALKSGTPYLLKYVHATTEFIVLGALDKSLLTTLDIINGTSLSALATDDTLPVYDLSATANRRILVSDFLKIVNSLTEDTSPDSANDFLLSYDASATAAKKVKPQSLPVVLPRGYIDGLTLSNGTDATNDINIAAGTCRDATNTVNITIAAALGKQLDANWVAGGTTGTPLGGRDSAASITNATYHIYAVATAAGVADVYMTTATTAGAALTALALESGGSSYLYARHIGSIVRTGAAIVLFVQNADYVRFKTPTTVTATVTTARANKALSYVPTGLSVKADLSIIVGTVDSYVYISCPDDTDVAPSSSFASTRSINAATTPAFYSVFTDASAQFAHRANTGSATNIDVLMLGYTHPRGRNA